MTHDSRLDELYAAAQMYYGDGQTMESIAGELDVSRSTVSRMLRDAREAELVTISLRPPEAQRVEELARRISRQYGVQVHVVPSVSGDDQHERLRTVAEAGGALLDEMLEPGHHARHRLGHHDRGAARAPCTPARCPGCGSCSSTAPSTPRARA